jgi:hypothetical protein
MEQHVPAPQPATSVVSTPELGSIYLNAQPWALTISDNLHSTFVIDREGRPLSCFRDGGNYRFGLSGDILLKVAAPAAPKLRRTLSADEGARLRAAFRDRLARIAARPCPPSCGPGSTWPWPGTRSAPALTGAYSRRSTSRSASCRRTSTAPWCSR